MKKSKTLRYFVTILSFVGTVILYQELPDRIPTHYNVHWEVDGYGPKYFALILGVLPIASCLLLDVLAKIDPKRSKHNITDKTYEIYQWIFALLFVALNWGNIILIQGTSIDGQFFLSVALGICFLIIGNYLPKVKPNYFLGIKTPWTLSNDVVWRKTHRVGGYMFILYGIISIMSYIIKAEFFAYILMIVMFVGVAYLCLYSYLIYRKETKKS